MFFPLYLNVTKPSSLSETEIAIEVPLKTVFTFPANEAEIVGGTGVH
jgi:hypothetical protein